MTSMLDIDPSAGKIKVVCGSRTVLDSTGRLVTLLPVASNFGIDASPQSVTLSYPDFTKDWLQNWRLKCHYNGGNAYALGERSDVWISVPKQDWSQSTILAAAPAGCNIVAAKVRINRTAAPASTWFGNTIAVKPPQNVWIPFTGSMLVEEMLGMARAFSLYIDSGNLVLHQQQSTAQPPAFVANNLFGGGCYGYGALPIAPGGGTPPSDQYAGEWSYGSAVGMSVFYNGFNNTSYTDTGVPLGAAPGVGGYCRRLVGASGAPGSTGTGGLTASVVDTTNFASAYQLDIVAAFGRAT